MEQLYRGGILINHGLCIGCKKCYDICPMDIFEFDSRKKLLKVAYPEECWYCGACIYDCPVEGALQMEIPMCCL
jgi:NAD-dependent dihydropyrimidine dehydrogenase PreA subunit